MFDFAPAKMPKDRYKNISCISERHRRRIRQTLQKNIIVDSNKKIAPTDGVVSEAIDPVIINDGTNNFNNFVGGVDTVDNAVFDNDEAADPLSDSENESDPEESGIFNLDNFFTDFTIWAGQGISQKKVSEILRLLKTHPDFSSLPNECRSVLRTPRSTEIVDVGNGKYCHLGIEKELIFQIEMNNILENTECLKLQFNFDGLPISQSSGSQVWPILMGFIDFPNIEPSVIGIYQGENKPTSCSEYLAEYVKEISHLKTYGLQTEFFFFNIHVHSYVCDAPARAFITNTKGHNAYHGCYKCEVEGEYIQNRVVFDEMDARRRTDESFKNKSDSDFHNGDTPLTDIPGINMITHFPLDYMHLICLGIMRKILMAFCKSKANVYAKLSAREISSMSARLTKCFSYIPCEFARKSRTLEYLARWKATEFRQFLLYTGPYVLSGILSKEVFEHFLCLHYAVRILLSSVYSSLMFEYARSLLNYFVKYFRNFYGHESLSYNVHNLIHICDDLEKLDTTLENTSAFKYENKLQSIKKSLRKHEHPLQQIVRRIEENKHVSKLLKKSKSPTNNIQVVKSGSIKNVPTNFSLPSFSSIKIKNYKISCTSPNNCVVLNSGEIVQINFLGTMNDTITMLGRKFETVQDFYAMPDSSQDVGIHKACNLSQNLAWSIDNIKCKAMMLPLESSDEDEWWYIAEMLHE
ncbi:hypothetical protein B566_EDAN005999 [Ephemera danica]|nr:hypothetical protein B566_EDAN005999 [Ephemera danica]